MLSAWLTVSVSRCSGEASNVSSSNDLMEFSIPRSALGLTSSSDVAITIQAATFENVVGWNNVIDTTRDIGSGPDAVDVLGGEVGVTANAWDRAFTDDSIIDSDDSDVILRFDVTIPGK